MVRFERILCPTDFSDYSMAAIPYAIELAGLGNSEIFLIHVIQVPPPLASEFGVQEHIAELASALRTNAEQRMEKLVVERIPAGTKSTKLLVEGRAEKEILEAVEKHDIDLITIATHGHTGWRHLIFGSVAERVVRMSPVPVLTVRARSSATKR